MSSLLKDLQSKANVYGVDKSRSSLRYCRKRGLKSIDQLDIEKRHPRINNFDVVTILDVIEHIKNDSLAIKNITKSLKINGILILSTPAFTFLWSYWDKVAGHYRRYDSKTLGKLIKDSGLKIEFLRYTNISIFPIAVLVRFIKQNLKFKNIGDHDSDFIKVPDFINSMLYYLLKFEMFISTMIFIPFGLSLIVVARKK